MVGDLLNLNSQHFELGLASYQMYMHGMVHSSSETTIGPQKDLCFDMLPLQQ